MRPPLVCATITAGTTAELRRRRDDVRLADMVELRLDTVADIDVAGALAGRRLPAIVTCRPVWEGGFFRGSERERHRILAEAMSAGADYVDIEWAAGFDDLLTESRAGAVVLSMHDFDGVRAPTWRAASPPCGPPAPGSSRSRSPRAGSPTA